MILISPDRRAMLDRIDAYLSALGTRGIYDTRISRK